MKQSNYHALENLSFLCHFCGVVIVFLGVLIGAMNGMSGEWKHAPTALFIFISGYAMTKISGQISNILLDEKTNDKANPYP